MTQSASRCNDCKDEPDGPCPLCAVEAFGVAGARSYLDACDRAERAKTAPYFGPDADARLGMLVEGALIDRRTDAIRRRGEDK